MSNKMEDKTKKPAAKRVLVPKLRFPEFRDAGGWKEKTLHHLAEPVLSKATEKEKNNILTLSGEHGLVLQSEYFGKKIAGENVERYVRVARNDFVYNDRTTKLSTYGSIKRLSKHESGIVSPIYKCFCFNTGENPAFWEWYFESGSHEGQLHGLVNEGARAGRFNISIEKFLSTLAWYPESEEQQKIADCLTSLDELIKLEAQKLDMLKNHKKGLMQQLFPAEGETLPKLRFPEFRDAGGWDKKELREFAILINEKAGQNKFTLMSITAGVGLVSQLKKFGREIAGAQYKNYFVIRKNDFAYNKSATKEYPEGFIDMYSGEEPGAVPNSIFTCFRINDHKVSPRYLNYLFLGNLHGKWLKKFITIGARAHGSLNIDSNDLLALPVPLPPREISFDEQSKIADCLSSIDELITVQNKNLDVLNFHKKGLMQQLFPALDEARG